MEAMEGMVDRVIAGVALGGVEVGKVMEGVEVGMAMEGVLVWMTVEGVVLGIVAEGGEGLGGGRGGGWNVSGTIVKANTMLNARGSRCWIMYLGGLYAVTFLYAQGWYLGPAS